MFKDNEAIGLSDIWTMNISDYITIDPAIRFGRPTLIGTRIAVSDVLNWLGNGMSVKDILNDYPELDEQMVKVCLLYAASRENRLGFAS